MSHYKSNLRDIEFNLFEVFGAGDLMGHGPFHDMDLDTAKSFLEQTNAVALGEISDAFASADRNPPVYDPKAKTVTMPEEFKAAFDLIVEMEGWRLEIPEGIGGIGCPPSLRWALAEMILGANPAIFMYQAGPGFAGIL
ncbi:MAG: acyl-CoA dehydrogenase family protein, partial [Pseudomonadota bacterium]|nr:acyl-CoA dehydrogenase family protein [Pseudomonadota bacterium]